MIQLMLLAALASPASDSTAAVQSSRFAFELSVREIDACCDGVVERASWDAQRRWAFGFFRWLVLSESDPDFSTLRSRSRVEFQLNRSDPEYLAMVAVHSSRWLETNRERLPVNSGPAHGFELKLFSEAVWVLAALEIDHQIAINKRELAIKQIDAAYQQVADEVNGAKRAAKVAVREAHVMQRSFDGETAFQLKRVTLERAISERGGEIKRQQDAFWAFEQEWKEATRELTNGSVQHADALAEYKVTAEKYNKRIEQIADEIVELTDRRDRLSFHEVRKRLDDLDRPPAAPPAALLGPPTPSSP